MQSPTSSLSTVKGKAQEIESTKIRTLTTFSTRISNVFAHCNHVALTVLKFKPKLQHTCFQALEVLFCFPWILKPSYEIICVVHEEIIPFTLLGNHKLIPKGQYIMHVDVCKYWTDNGPLCRASCYAELNLMSMIFSLKSYV